MSSSPMHPPPQRQGTLLLLRSRKHMAVDFCAGTPVGAALLPAQHPFAAGFDGVGLRLPSQLQGPKRGACGDVGIKAL